MTWVKGVHKKLKMAYFWKIAKLQRVNRNLWFHFTPVGVALPAAGAEPNTSKGREDRAGRKPADGHSVLRKTHLPAAEAARVFCPIKRVGGSTSREF
jgi:hypothetical protein